MEFEDEIAEIEEPLSAFREVAGPHFDAVRNHIYRMYYFTLELVDDPDGAHLPTAIAGVYHDIGVFTTGGMDYIDPSVTLAKDYLDDQRRLDLFPLISEMIRFHHKLTPYHGDHGKLVEAFRRADLADLSMGYLGSGVSRKLIRAAYKKYPPCGFHSLIYGKVLRWGMSNPFRPLPMMKP